ncbi:helix-turn-helix domain-containing protein [Microbacterium sp.]|uniref:helix-turn-helix domain-containing protein n=1 Tax=Microbacterium sp. TaxID=51671 RepID=UPI0039E5C262
MGGTGRADPGVGMGEKATASEIGARLRRVRMSAGVSLRAVAEAVGISSSALSQIEKGTMQPSVNRLVEIVTVLGVPVSAIFDDHGLLGPMNVDPARVTEPLPGVFVAAGESAPIATLGQGVLYRRLTPVRLDGLDLFESTYPPLTSSSVDGAMLVHEGYEVGRVVSGTLTFEFTDGSVVLGPGGSLSFWATQPHRVVNMSAEQAAVALWLTVRHARPEVASIAGIEASAAALLEELAAETERASDQLPR